MHFPANRGLFLLTLGLQLSPSLFAEAKPLESALGKQAIQYFEKYCFDCHDE